jgi:hypothetical protein
MSAMRGERGRKKEIKEIRKDDRWETNAWRWGEERNKIKRKGNEGGLGGEKNFGGFLSRHFWKGHAMSIFFKGFFFFFWVGVARTPQPSTQVRPCSFGE